MSATNPVVDGADRTAGVFVPGLRALTPIAHGGYSTVYEAIQVSVGRRVALKVDNSTLDTELDRRRFEYESRATGRVSGHPHVIDLFDAGVSPDGHPYLVMELCTGSYAELTGRVTPAEVRIVGTQIADALAAAHSAGVLHRDVKPGNILLTRYQSPVLADFGLAVLLDQRDGTEALDLLTPAYAPPESLQGAQPAPAGDVYALAATLYALLAGHPPRLPGPEVPTAAALLDLYDQPVPDIPDVPTDLLNILRRTLATDPAARPTAARLRDLLMAPGR